MLERRNGGWLWLRQKRRREGQEKRMGTGGESKQDKTVMEDKERTLRQEVTKNEMREREKE